MLTHVGTKRWIQHHMVSWVTRKALACTGVVRKTVETTTDGYLAFQGFFGHLITNERQQRIDKGRPWSEDLLSLSWRRLGHCPTPAKGATPGAPQCRFQHNKPTSILFLFLWVSLYLFFVLISYSNSLASFSFSSLPLSLLIASLLSPSFRKIQCKVDPPTTLGLLFGAISVLTGRHSGRVDALASKPWRLRPIAIDCPPLSSQTSISLSKHLWLPISTLITYYSTIKDTAKHTISPVKTPSSSQNGYARGPQTPCPDGGAA